MRKKINSILSELVLSLLLFLYLSPIIMLMINSFKPYVEIMDSFISLPKNPTVLNYQKAWKALDFGATFLNTLFFTVLSVVLVLFVSTLAAYGIARTRTRLSRFLNNLFVVPYLVPFFSIMIPILQMAKVMNLNNSIIGISLVNAGISSSFALLMCIIAVKQIPIGLEEACFIDGGNKLVIYSKIVLPLIKPTLFSISTIYALWAWNNFTLPYFMLTKTSKQTLMIRVYDLFGLYGTDWEIVIASLVIVSIPIIVLYSVFQKYIIGGMTAGAIKG